MAGGSGSSAAGSSSGSGVPSSIDAYPALYAEAVCAVLERCWTAFTAELDVSCESYFERQTREGPFVHVAAAVADGRLQYHGEQAQGCFDAIVGVTCGEGLTLAPDDCDGVLVGSLAIGEPCTLDAECTGEAQCLVDGSCPGVCGPRRKEGEACTTSNRCELDLICLISSGETDGTCVVPTRTEGGVCSSTQPCSGFFYCAGLDRGDPESTGTCQPPDDLYSGALNEACGIGGELVLCEPGLVCAIDSAGGTCQQNVASGAACQYALPDACPTDEYCRIADPTAVPYAGTCTPRPQLGEQCAYGPGLVAPCASDQYCGAETGACEQYKHLGEPCIENEACFSESCVEGKCTAPLECERAAL
jgi:hypothetical protein